MAFQIVTEVITFFLDAYQEALDTLPVISMWLKSLVSPKAVVWYALGLLTLPLYQNIRIRFKFWRMKRRLASKVKRRPRRPISFAMWTLAKAYPKAPIEIRTEEIENILNVLSKAIEIAGGNQAIDWKRVRGKVDSSWLVLQSHILVEMSESTLVVAVAGPGLVAPPPTGPGQHSLR